jgi:mannose-1-phosphate guanylyltransferase/mannose-1-phosphate guanylyltransferase/mannose-6-phosphate isomerase
MSAGAERRVVPVILSGGAGTRLWPLSRRARPKQMLDLAGQGPMLAQTAERVTDASLFAPPLVVAGKDQAAAIAAVLPRAELILEPVARNTAPAIALAALSVDKEDVLLILPSDHLVADPERFRDAVRRAWPWAADGWIVTFGMKPERAETGYGYIERGAGLDEGIHHAVRFVEKPDAATAGRYAASGRYDWNGGIFLMRAGTYLAALQKYAPKIATAAKAAMEGAVKKGRRLHPDSAAFAESLSESIDYAVMEKAEKIAVVPVSIGWSDVGSWEALLDRLERDGQGNALTGDVLEMGTKNCLIRSEGPLIAAIGIEDLVVIATQDAVLIVPRTMSQKVKDVVETLKERGRDEWT